MLLAEFGCGRYVGALEKGFGDNTEDVDAVWIEVKEADVRE